jgi:hypothetical protein
MQSGRSYDVIAFSARSTVPLTDGKSLHEMVIELGCTTESYEAEWLAALPIVGRTDP